MKFEEKISLYSDGLVYTLPKMPPENEIDGYELPSSKQKFKRKIFLSNDAFEKLSPSSKTDIQEQELINRVEGYWFFNNGVPTYITGSHYFTLNYWYMAAMTPDGYGEYRDAQRKWLYFIDLCEKDPMCFGGIMMSAKRFFKTEVSLAHIYNQATLIERDCLFGMQSLNWVDARSNLFKGRILRSHRRIPIYLKPESNDSGKKEISSELTFMGNKKGGGLNNVIDHRPTLASAYQGKRPREVFIDEPGTIEEMDLDEAVTTIKQQLQIGKRAFGKLFMPFTLESMLPRCAPIVQRLWEESNPNKRDANGRTVSWLYRYFNPQYEGREDFVDEFGNSLIEEAKQFRVNELAVATPSKQKKIKRQYPENTDEAFDVVVSGFWWENVKSLLTLCKKEIPNKNLPIKRVKLIAFGDNVRFDAAKYNDDEAVSIFEDPKPHVKYYAGFDGVGSDKETGNEKGSCVSVTIIKGADSGSNYEYLPVAYFKFRPERMPDGYAATLNICRHYGQHGNLKLGIERNAGQGSPLIAYFINRGYRKMLMKKQKIVGINDDSNSELYGWYRNDEVIDVQKSYANTYLENFAHNIPFIELIDSLIDYGRSNQDFADSFISAVYTMGDFSRVEKKRTPKQTTQWFLMPPTRGADGRMKENWVERQVMI